MVQDTDVAVETAVAEAVDALTLLGWILGGLVVGVVAMGIAVFVGAWLTKRSALLQGLLRHGRVPLLCLGGALGMQIALLFPVTGDVWQWVDHLAIILTILAVTLVLFRFVRVFEDVTMARFGQGESDRARRVTTQTQVLRRVVQALIVTGGIVGVALTFPAAQLAFGSLLASAGLISLIAGLAAQSTLGNMFAGMQIAFTDAIHVGDIVVVASVQGSNNGGQGTVEEITLTYVVVRCWDERRIILPSSYFTKEPFENWTRAGTELTGAVELELDWEVDVEIVRQKVADLLEHTDLWDKRVCKVQMLAIEAQLVRLRVAVSAADSGQLWDLRCYLREELSQWIREEFGEAMPRTRLDIAGPANPMPTNPMPTDPSDTANPATTPATNPAKTGAATGVAQ